MSWRDFWRFASGPTVEDLEAAAPSPPRAELSSDKREIAAAAKQLLEEPVFRLALERVEGRLYETWKASGAGGAAVREEAYRLHWAIDELRAELRRMVDSARVPSGVAPPGGVVPQGLNPIEREQ